MTAISLTMALVMGLAGSLHCAGMCGPIIWIMPFQALSGVRKWLGIALYHLGRISVYATLGLILHSFKFLFQPLLQQYISIALGVLLLAIGIVSFMSSKVRLNWPWSGVITRQLGRFVGNPRLGNLFVSGALNGLLPCGLVYMALSMAVTAEGALQSMFLMYAFGAGTIPMLVVLTALKFRVSHLLPGVRRIGPVLVFCIGCLLLVRGMNLGIPYLSPELEMHQGSVKATCCHKP